MDARALVVKLIERENKYLADQEVGTEEYNASLERLTGLEEKLVDLDKVKNDKKHRVTQIVLEAVKIATGVALPIFGIVALTAQEREITYTSALKSLISCFIPGKIK